MKHLVFTICFFSVFLMKAQDTKVIFWEDLKPKSEFKDPFKDIGLAELQALGKLARLNAKQKKGTILTKEEVSKKAKYEKLLTEKKIDYKYLFENREKIVAQRKHAINGLNTELENTKIEISGYLLPLNFENGKSNEFLLVPWVGACIHTPPPPKNQIIYVTIEDWMEAPGLFDAVILKGKVSITEKISNLYLEDGSSLIQTGYSVNNAKIYKI